MNSTKSLLGFLEIDRAIAYTLLGRGWQVVAGLITLWLVVKYLTPAEQGFYYTFASILALQVFFELGLGYVILQFASHEKAHLRWTADGMLEGDIIAKNRLRSLFRFALRWYGVVALLVFVAVLPGGWFFFSIKHPGESVAISWQVAWIWLVVSTALIVLVNPIFSLLEGCGLVADVARVRLLQSLVGSSVVWLVLAGHGGLLAAPAMSMSLALVAVGWLIHSKRNFLRDMFACASEGGGVRWLSEIWPFQWKIAVSWLSGYFIFQLFNPVLFVYRGPVEAGQMGMSISIAGAMMSVPMAWMSTKLPQFGVLIARRNFVELDELFFKAFWRSLGIIIALAIILSAANFILHQYQGHIAARILDPFPFLLLMATTVLNYLAFAQAAYLRAHKREPFLLPSLFGGLMVGGSTILLAKDHGAAGVMTGYFIIAILASLLGTWIFQTKRRKWHKA